MPTPTANFNLQKPDVGADDNDWGDYLNDALDIIDAKLKALELPVGSLYLSTVATNPATLLGYGTWAAYAAGRALVGVGTADSVVWAAGDLKGAATHTLTAAEMPSHTHGAGSLSAASGGSHTHSDTFSIATSNLTGSFDVPRQNTGSEEDIISNATGVFTRVSGSTSNLTKLENGGAGADRVRVSMDVSHSHTLNGSVSSGGAHTHSVTGTSGSAGSGDAHNNIQPSIAVYVWQRTA